MIPEIEKSLFPEIKAFVADIDLQLNQNPGLEGMILLTNRAKIVSMVLDYFDI
jgi:hypothetical protein